MGRVTLGKSLHLSAPPFPHLHNGDNSFLESVVRIESGDLRKAPGPCPGVLLGTWLLIGSCALR